LAETLALAADEADKAGIDLALEHLNQGECNVFTSLAECQAFIQERGLQHMRLLADLHHLEVEHEPLAAVRAAGPLLAHVHVADGERRAPGGGGYDYSGFMRAVRATGYDRRISAECLWEDLNTEAGPALAFMRQRWEDAAGQSASA
jgi:D-psicose/D-tagatose/L-ribulose 3-epimerase